MIQYDTLLAEAEEFVRQLFETKVPENYHFHNLHHTLGVVKAVEILAAHYKLNGEDLSALLLAAWFHDSGYSVKYDGHEAESVEIVKGFLQDRRLDGSL